MFMRAFMFPRPVWFWLEHIVFMYTSLERHFEPHSTNEQLEYCVKDLPHHHEEGHWLIVEINIYQSAIPWQAPQQGQGEFPL